MGVRCEDHLAALVNGEAGEIGVEVLTARKAVDFDCYAGIRTAREDLLPPCSEPRAMVEVAAARVGKNVHTGGFNGAYEALGLITVGVELAVHRGHHALHLEPLAPRHIEGAVQQDLDLETLEQTVILPVLAIPSRDPPLL